MKSFDTLKNLFGSLSQNTNSDNLTLGAQLINDAHRYLLQKYFNNEFTSFATTIGAMDLTTTASLSANATSATLTSAWTYATSQQLVNFSNGDQRMVNFTSGSTAITWNIGLSDTATTAISTVGVQAYQIPANYSKMKDVNISVGQLKWTLVEIKTRQEWDQINFLPYTSDIPQYYFIYNNQVNIITYNYKIRVPDLTFADYTTGTVTITNNSVTVTGSGSGWLANYITTAGSALNLNLYLKPTAPIGDNNWYQVSSIASATSLALANNYTGSTQSGASYTIGQMPLLVEDFHDLLVYRPLVIYYSSINPDPDKAKQFKGLYDEGIEQLEEYCGTKSVNVDLGQRPQTVNPNLFLYANQ